jgi:hypothetical protein
MKQFIFDPATTPLTIPLDFLKLFHSSDNPVGLASFLRGVVGVASLPPAGPFYFTKPAALHHVPHFPTPPRPALSANFTSNFSQN